jgi:hypothetical protein
VNAAAAAVLCTIMRSALVVLLALCIPLVSAWNGLAVTPPMVRHNPRTHWDRRH